jgi:hypothetical protein
MTITAHAAPTTSRTGRVPMDTSRKTSLFAGGLYLLTFVSIPTLALYKPVKDDVGSFVLGAGSTTGLMWGALSEVIVALAGISTAVVLFPVLKRQSETAALGLVTARLLESALIVVSVVSLLTVVTLRNDVAGTAGADSASIVTAGHSLVAVYNWTFLLSQAFLPVIVDLLLGYLLYRSGLVPRILPIIAFVGAPLLFANDIAVFFGVYEKGSLLDGLAAMPVALFEFSFGVYLIVKGFKPSPITAAMAAASTPRAPRGVDA